jgi:hypothetical protein
MKKLAIFVFLYVLCSWSPLFSHAQNFNTAGDYMQYMLNDQDKINKDMWDYISTIAHSNSARKAEARRKELVATTADAVKRISKIGPWDGDVAFRDSVISYLKLCDIVLREDFSKILDLEAIAEQSYDAMEAYMLAKEKANDKLDDASAMVRAEQAVFAADHNITLIESKDKVVQRLERAGTVFNYYNQVYLIFFKPYKQEVYLMEAMSKGDISAMEQIKNSLSSLATESLQKLDTMKSFNGDGSLTQVCKEYMDFFKK